MPDFQKCGGQPKARKIANMAQKWHWIDSIDLWRNWAKGEIIQKGLIPLPEQLGLGVGMNDDAARKAQAPGTPWFGPTRRR
jgi:L-alanine-DL-glutamate epimerase-like enolase superfamily enzyme